MPEPIVGGPEPVRGGVSGGVLGGVGGVLGVVTSGGLTGGEPTLGKGLLGPVLPMFAMDLLLIA